MIERARTHHFSPRALRRTLVLAAAILLAGCGAQAAVISPAASPSLESLSPTATATRTVDPTPTKSLGPTFQPIDVWATPTPKSGKAVPTAQDNVPQPRRPSPAQDPDWLALKAAGRVALVDGQRVILPPEADPLVMPDTGQPVPGARTLDISYSRWIIEPTGGGRDELGRAYTDENYWQLCEVGATTVALSYWQTLTGHPDVRGTKGYFIDPYASEGVAWPSPGPILPRANGKVVGTYFSGEDHVSGYTAYARGYMLYLATQVQPPGWKSTGMAVFAVNGRPIYKTFGAPRPNIIAALNWEASDHDEDDWMNFWYAGVTRFEPTLARDLQMAVTLDVGRDGVPVVAVLDAHDLPNWQAGAATRHLFHGIAIVGYDNTANPPTYSYVETCGRQCNSRAGNYNGKLQIAPQSVIVDAIQDTLGSGFVW
jgi:hypothetical protein